MVLIGTTWAVAAFADTCIYGQPQECSSGYHCDYGNVGYVYPGLKGSCKRDRSPTNRRPTLGGTTQPPIRTAQSLINYWVPPTSPTEPTRILPTTLPEYANNQSNKMLWPCTGSTGGPARTAGSNGGLCALPESCDYVFKRVSLPGGKWQQTQVVECDGAADQKKADECLSGPS